MSYFIAAYLLIWLLLMGYLFYLARKQRKIRKGIDFLQDLIDEDKQSKDIQQNQQRKHGGNRPAVTIR